MAPSKTQSGKDFTDCSEAAACRSLNRTISPIVAAALCIKPHGLLTANQAATVDALKKDWPEFAAMPRLAMRFRGMLKSKNVDKLGV